MGEPFVGYSNVFSFNHPNGMCPQCEGIGIEQTIDIYIILDLDKSLNEEGAIDFLLINLQHGVGRDMQIQVTLI